MRFRCRTSRWCLLACSVVIGSFTVALQSIAAEQTTGPPLHVWLDVDGKPLPFQDHAAIQDALQEAAVISRRPIGRGVAGAQKLVLDYGGDRFHAAFRTVDVRVRHDPVSGGRRPVEYRDAAVFESAAYALSELFGIGRVPPVVERRVEGDGGTAQIWMEQTLPEVELIERGEFDPPDTEHFRRQKQVMRVFDSLIANSDRNQGNLLIDDDWNIWLIDHTRAFRQTSALLDKDKLVTCERSLWKTLQAVDEEAVRNRLEPFLERREITYLLRRQAALVRHFEKLIEKHGEASVLFDLPSASGTGDRTAVVPQIPGSRGEWPHPERSSRDWNAGTWLDR